MPRSLWARKATERPRVCTIAGSDSGGGAGIQADLKTFLALGSYGLSVITALTAQNTAGVSGIHIPPKEFLRQQLQSVIADIRIDAWKIGMLANSEVIETIANELRMAQISSPIVLDPVMISTSGSLLLSPESIRTLIDQMVPLCALLTPNLPEARQLLAYHRLHNTEAAISITQNDTGSVSLDIITELMAAAKQLSNIGPQAVLVKGGHQPLDRQQLEVALTQMGICTEYEVGSSLEQVDTCASLISRNGFEMGARLRSKGPSSSDGASSIIVVQGHLTPHSQVLRELTGQGVDPQVVLDVLYTRAETPSVEGTYTFFVGPMLRQSCTHGTGCTLSSALAAYLSQDEGALSPATLRSACWKSIQYVQAAILRGYEDLGSGAGALDHATSLSSRGVLPTSAPTILSTLLTVTEGLSQSDAHELDESIADRLGSDPTPFTTRLLSRSMADWRAYVRHPFIVSLAAHDRPAGATQVGPKLPLQSFLYFLKQDYHFLLHYSRVWATAASTSRSFDESRFYLDLAKGMASEAQGHVDLCEKYFGLHKSDLEAEPEGAATVAYTRFVLDVARGGEGVLALLVATMPCLLGYAEMATVMRELTCSSARCDEDSQTPAEERTIKQGIRRWWTQYAENEYHAAVRAGLAKIEEEAFLQALSPHQMTQLQQVWDAAVRLEVGIWDEAMKSQDRQTSAIWSKAARIAPT